MSMEPEMRGRLQYLEGTIKKAPVHYESIPVILVGGYGYCYIENYNNLPPQSKRLIRTARRRDFRIAVIGSVYKEFLSDEGFHIVCHSVTIPETIGCLSLWEGDGLEGALTKYEEEGGLSIVADD